MQPNMADPARIRWKADILNILTNSDDELRAFRRRIENKYVIIFVGSTRNGKSTLVNFITDTPLVAFQDGNSFRIQQQNGANPGPSIAHGTLSHTTIPSIIEMAGKPDTVIIDAPGFGDNRGPAQEIINALYINQIKYSKGVRFVLVSDISNIVSDNINLFLDFIETVHTIMPDFVKLQGAVSIIFTKDWKNYNQRDIITILREKVLNVDALRCKKDLIKHFSEREDLIGLFKMPTTAGALTKEVDINVHGAIFKSLPINLNETDIKFGISKSARIVLLETYLEFFDVVISLKEIFLGYKTSALEKFIGLKKEKLLLLTDEQLNNNHGGVQTTIDEYYNYILNRDEERIFTSQIPDALQKIFIEDVNRVTSALKSIGVYVPTQVDPRFNLNAIEEIRKKLEYITCIERVVEYDNKSKEILAFYQENTKIFKGQIKELRESIHNEIAKRTLLFVRLGSIPNIRRNLSEVNDQYLSASVKGELISMKNHLETYMYASNKILEEISQRPALQRRSVAQIYSTSAVHREIESKIEEINTHIEARDHEIFLKIIPSPIKSIVGTLMLYVGMAYIRHLSQPHQLEIFAGSILLFAAFSWKSNSVRSRLSRLRKRYHQRRIYRSRTKLDDCWKDLLLEPEPRLRFLRN